MTLQLPKRFLMPTKFNVSENLGNTNTLSVSK